MNSIAENHQKLHDSKPFDMPCMICKGLMSEKELDILSEELSALSKEMLHQQHDVIEIRVPIIPAQPIKTVSSRPGRVDSHIDIAPDRAAWKHLLASIKRNPYTDAPCEYCINEAWEKNHG